MASGVFWRAFADGFEVDCPGDVMFDDRRHGRAAFPYPALGAIKTVLLMPEMGLHIQHKTPFFQALSQVSKSSHDMHPAAARTPSHGSSPGFFNPATITTGVRETVQTARSCYIDETAFRLRSSVLPRASSLLIRLDSET